MPKTNGGEWGFLGWRALVRWLRNSWRRVRERWRRLVRRMRRVGTITDGSQPDTRTPMVGRTVIFLVVYLTALGVAGLWTIWTLWVARPPEAVEEPWPPPEAAADPQAAPVITEIQPDTLAFGAGLPVVRVFGTGYTDESEVLLDGVPASAVFIPPHQMSVTLTEGDFRLSRTVAVTVLRGDSSSLPVPLRIQSESGAQVAWARPLADQPLDIGVETRFILLVILFGGVGGILASFNSLSDYRGEGRLMKSWFLHYWVAPYLGAGVALFMYMVVRAGFLAGTEVRIDGGATPWGLVTVSALAGLFYDKTLLKLREVFITLFAPKDERTGKLTGDDSSTEGPFDLEMVSAALEPAIVHASYRQRLQARGGEEPYSWSVEPDLPGGLVLDPMTGLITGRPTEEKARASYRFTVSDMKRKAVSVDLELEVRDS